MRRLMAVAAAGAIALGVGAVIPIAAEARPFACGATKIVNTFPEAGTAYCTAGEGHYRALVYCTANPQNGYGAYYYGDWWARGSGAMSYRQCPSDRPYVVSAGYDLADW